MVPAGVVFGSPVLRDTSKEKFVIVKFYGHETITRCVLAWLPSEKSAYEAIPDIFYKRILCVTVD